MAILKNGRFKVVPGTHYGTPKELWGFRWRAPRTTPAAIAKQFVRGEVDRLGLAGVMTKLSVQRVIEGLGASHVILRQRYRNITVHRAYVTVHVSHDRHVYLVKNRAVPSDYLKPTGDFRLTRHAAERRVLRKIRARKADVRITDVQRRWFPKGEKLHPAHRVRVHRKDPRAEFITYVDAATGGILSHYDNLAFVRGTAQVFNPNPVTALNDWGPLLTPAGHVRQPPLEAYTRVDLADLTGNGRLDGRRVTTKPTPDRVRSSDQAFAFPSSQPGFLEAMVYFHIDRAIHYLESLGYRGARRIFLDPLPVNAHGTRQDNSWYSPGMRSLTFGTGGVDDAEDAEIILHEFGHALQDAICPDFGQSLQAAAMGEGFGDYFAASFFAAAKPRRFRDCVMSWDAIADADGTLPYVRRMDEPLTFESFDHSDEADEHDNGMIWSGALWDIWKALGREIADPIIIDSHFQLDGFTTFARAARAIIDADQNLNGGRHAATLRRIFRRRGIGPVE